MTTITRVLVVDDSAYMRKAVREMLLRSPFIEVVGTARDGDEALELVERLNPHVVTLDLLMPGLDGLGFLRAQMARRPLPVVVVSVAQEGSDLALQALDAGAVDVVQKPTGLASERIFELADALIASVKAAATALPRQPAGPAARLARPSRPGPSTGQVDIVVIGVSTGGPQALKTLVPQLPADFPVPLAIVLHMPVGYTGPYAHSLNQLAALEVVEAQQGAELVAGQVMLAQAGQHLLLRRSPTGRLVARLDARPLDMLHRPAVDLLFQSAAELFGQRTLALVMTGMGSDGLQGAAWVKARGGMIFAEAAESCIVYGMPRAVIEAGLADKVLPLDRLAQALLEVV